MNNENDYIYLLSFKFYVIFSIPTSKSKNISVKCHIQSIASPTVC